MTTITIDQKSIEAAAAGQLDLDALVNEMALPSPNNTSNCTTIRDHGYILSRSFQAGDGLLTISLKDDGPLTALTTDVRKGTLGRLLRCAVMIFTGRPRSIPMQWRPFHDGNRIAFQADRKVRAGGKTDAGRIVMDVTQDVGPRLFAFLLDRDGTQDISTFVSDVALFNDAMAGIIEAASTGNLAKRDGKNPEQLSEHIVLDESMVGSAVPHVSLDDWYNSHLTVTQRRLVDHPLSSSVRLVGPAGSGKTVTLAVKCLRELQISKEEKITRRILFLTHASSTASGIENLILEMHPALALEALASNPPLLVVTTLYALADHYMKYDLADLTPVSLDGHEGRAFQAEVLNEIIEMLRKADWITLRSGCSEPFIAYIEAANDSNERRFFLWELLNEFACVLDAEGVRSATERREKYLTDQRRAWMMQLHSREERETVLQLYDRFRTWLREVKAIGSDQMIADFLNYLDSYRWEATREKEGFDVVFVDELHLFNRQERMLFRYLLRSPTTPPAVFMAYDAKQSPRDTFLGLPGKGSQRYDLWKDARLGKMEKIELLDVFRYTPQIARALASIDRSFPGQDLDSDWPAYSGISRTQDGPMPIACELENDIASYSVVFKRAKWWQSRLSRERRVAVLCCSFDRFKAYLERPEFRNDFYAITSRDDAMGILSSRKKYILSMPEYVAGLQYDTVLLTDVNRSEVPDGPFSASAQRKFVSLVYLGASRAERRLEIYASGERGGLAPLLTVAFVEGVIERVEDSDKLPTKDI